MANARDWRVGVNLIGLTNFISTVIGPNLASCHVKLVLVTPLGSKTRNLALWFIYSDVLFKNSTRKKCVLLSEFTTVKHRKCKIWSTWRWTDFSESIFLSRVEGRGSRVPCRGSRVEGRGSRVIFITKTRFLSWRYIFFAGQSSSVYMFLPDLI